MSSTRIALEEESSAKYDVEFARAEKPRLESASGVAFPAIRSYRSSMQTVSVKLPDDFLGRLDELASQTGEDRSALIRQSVGLLVARNRSGSAHQKLAHLCGVFKGGAKEASVSERYKDGFLSDHSRLRPPMDSVRRAKHSPRWRRIISGAVALMLAAYFALREHEPSAGGRTLSEWLHHDEADFAWIPNDLYGHTWDRRHSAGVWTFELSFALSFSSPAEWRRSQDEAPALCKRPVCRQPGCFTAPFPDKDEA